MGWVKIIVLHLLMGVTILLLHEVHSNLQIDKMDGYFNATFFVVFAFFLKMGLVYPP